LKKATLAAAAVAACMTALPVYAPAAARPFSFADYSRIVGVDDPQISPDGKYVVIVVSHVDEDKDRNPSELVLVDTATGAKRDLTYGRDDASSPRWSSDGTQLAFIDAAGDDKTPQVWVMPMNGGEARPVTHAKYGVEVFSWRPDGKAVAYVTPDTPPNEASIKKHDDLFHVGNNSFLTHAAPIPSHIWVQEIGANDPQRLTEGTWSIYPDSLSWSANGKYIAFDRTPNARFNGILHSAASVVDVATKKVTVLSSKWSFLTTFAPQGNRIAFTNARGPALILNDLSVATLGGGVVDNAAPSLDRDVDFLAWLPHGNGWLVGANDHVQHALWRVSESGAVQKVNIGDMDFGSGTVAQNGAVAFVGSGPRHPGELFYLPPDLSKPRALTDYNAAIAQLNLAPSTEFTWHNAGFTEDGVLTYPLGYVRGHKYPLALMIHGGPTDGASTASFSSRAQILAAAGFFVLQPNYRGSDNLGYKYASAIIGDGPIIGVGSDVYAGTRALIATGMVDDSRVGASGWSAGGWTTSWLITHYPIYKAAVTGAAVDDAVMQATFSQINDYAPELFGGLTPWTDRGMDVYRKNSPVTYAKNDNAATLILSDTNDPRVPTPQSYEFFQALRAYGKNVEFIAIPAYGHHPSDPVRNKAIDRVWTNWLIEHLAH